MKLITVNVWGGIVYEPLVAFIKKHASDIDVFCFQEMFFGNEVAVTPVYHARANLFQEMEKCLPEFGSYAYLSPTEHFQDEPISVKAGQAIFVRKNLVVTGSGGFSCYPQLPVDATYGGELTGNAQWVELEHVGQAITIVNLHGLWQKGTSKADTPQRIMQSNIIAEFFSKKNGKKILCGDFNLRSGGESLALLEKGMRNLIAEYGIQSTRSDFYDKPGKLGDYILVSPDVQVVDFKVFEDQVSDHLPVSLEFN